MELKEKITAILQEEVYFSDPSKPYVSTQIIETHSGKKFFLKSGPPSRTYHCEANGLKEILKAEAIACPAVVGVDTYFLLTEYIQSGTPSALFFESFGM